MSRVQKITPFLWFDDQAEEAAALYVSVFKDSKIRETSRYSEGGRDTPGKVMTVTFELAGQEFVALNGGPRYRFTEAISFVVRCATQEEIDHFWERLSAGGSEGPCGWLKDRYGVSWQIIPDELGALLGQSDPVKAKRATEAMLSMGKLDIAALRRASEGR